MKILFGKDAREKIKTGIDMCSDTVKVSLGHKGKNVLISNGQVVDIVNDGVTIAKFVTTKEEDKLAGIRLAQQCASMTDQIAGDGTTTTLVLLQSFLDELLSETQLEQPRVLRKKVLDSVDSVTDKLDKASKKVSKNDIESIALTACLDSDIAKIISDIFKKLGNDANITINETRYDTIDGKITEGFQFDSVYKNVYKEDKVELTDIPVAVFPKKAAASDILPKIAALNKDGSNQILVIAGQFSKDLQGLATRFNAKGEFDVHLVENKDINHEDIESLGNKFEKVIIEKNKTTMLGGNGDIKEHVKKLKEKLSKEESSFQKELLEARISSLTSGIAVITVGGKTDVEREERKLKVEDAISATKTSLKHGYVKGGGVALKEAGKGEFIEETCSSIYNQICENAEEDVKIGEEVKDSVLTIKAALRSAASIATSVLTAEAALIEEDEE